MGHCYMVLFEKKYATLLKVFPREMRPDYLPIGSLDKVTLCLISNIGKLERDNNFSEKSMQNISTFKKVI